MFLHVLQRCELDMGWLCLQGTAVLACRLPNMSPICCLRYWFYDLWSYMTLMILGPMLAPELFWRCLQPLWASLYRQTNLPIQELVRPTRDPATLPHEWMENPGTFRLQILKFGGFQMPLPMTGSEGRERHPHHATRWQLLHSSREEAVKCDHHSRTPRLLWSQHICVLHDLPSYSSIWMKHPSFVIKEMWGCREQPLHFFPRSS